MIKINEPASPTISVYLFPFRLEKREQEKTTKKEMKNILINLPKSVYVTDPPLILSIADVVAEVVGIVAKMNQCKRI